MDTPSPSGHRRRSPWDLLLHPLAAWNLAVAQPLFEVIRRHPPFLTAHRAGFWDLILLALAVSLLIPLAAALGLVTLGRWHPRRAERALSGLVGLTGGAILWQLGQGLEPAARIGLAVAAAGATTIAHQRWLGLRRWLAVTAVGALVFPVLFVTRATPWLEPTDESRTRLPWSSAGDPRPVVLAIFDEWPLVSVLGPGGALNRERYPHLAELADSATWYPNATTVAANTAKASPAILTGLWPANGVTGSVTDYPLNLFTLLANDYEMNVYESSTALCPEALCGRAPSGERRRALLADTAAIALRRFLPAPWNDRLPAVDQDWAGFWHTRRDADDHLPRDRPLDRYREFLARMDRYPTATLHFIHIHIPHLPWRRLPSGQRYDTISQDPHGLVKQFWRGTPWEVLQAEQRHLLQVGLVDTLVGELLKSVDALPGGDGALVMVMSDHGASFQPGRLRRNLTPHNRTEITNVPLWVRGPGFEAGGTDERNASTLDLLPTVLDSIGLDYPGALDGSSLLGAAPTSDLKTTYGGDPRGLLRGREFTYSVADLDRRGSAGRIAKLFGAGASDQIYDLGSRPALHGRRLDEFELDRDAAVVRLRRGAILTFDPSAPTLPIHLIGRLRGYRRVTTPIDLAISFEDRIVATTQTYLDPDLRHRFTALLDPADLVTGDNPIEIFVVGGSEDEPVLRATRIVSGQRRKEG